MGTAASTTSSVAPAVQSGEFCNQVSSIPSYTPGSNYYAPVNARQYVQPQPSRIYSQPQAPPPPVRHNHYTSHHYNNHHNTNIVHNNNNSSSSNIPHPRTHDRGTIIASKILESHFSNEPVLPGVPFNNDNNNVTNGVNNINLNGVRSPSKQAPLRPKPPQMKPDYFTDATSSSNSNSNSNSSPSTSNSSPTNSTSEPPLIHLSSPEGGESDNDTAKQDRYRWRKYGSKKTKGSNRAYFKCREPNCEVRKITETMNDDGSVCDVYKGTHNHKPPPVFTYTIPDAASFKAIHKKIMTSKLEGVEQHPKFVLTLNVNVSPLEDGFHWRKYGQKSVKGNSRSYFKCTHPNCSVKKQVEKFDTHYLVTYEDTHNHLAGDNAGFIDDTASASNFPRAGTKRTRDPANTTFPPPKLQNTANFPVYQPVLTYNNNNNRNDQYMNTSRDGVESSGSDSSGNQNLVGTGPSVKSESLASLVNSSDRLPTILSPMIDNSTIIGQIPHPMEKSRPL